VKNSEQNFLPLHPAACLNDAFLDVSYPLASPVEGQSLQQKDKKRRKRKGKKKIQKSKSLRT